MIKNLYYHFKLLYFPYWIPIQSFNTITLNASFENTKKIKFIGGVFFFVSLCSVLNDLFRWRNFYNLDQSYFNHTLILLIAPLFSSILFFFKVKTIEEFKKYYKRNLFLTSSYVIFLVFVTAGLGFFEFTTFKKQVAYSIFIVFINYLLLLNRYQRLFFNLSLWLVAILVFSFTAHNQHLYIVELVSISIIIVLSGILSHRQYVSWKENMINKEKLNKINTKLELTVAYLNNSKIQLVASNNNLQDFVYAISHDLREPIRISNNLLEIIMIKGRHYITPSELNLLEEVKSNNKMMNSMLEDLLEYSKLGNITSLNNIDLNLVLEKALGLMKNNLEKNQVFITKDTLPTIQCVEVEMLSLFQNLINNSIKYKKSKLAPIIEINYSKLKKHHQITYRDNGIGIPKNELQNVFNIFYRAKNTKNISGTGIGLSICKKVIENLGGQIQLDSDEQAGIILTILLPLTKQ